MAVIADVPTILDRLDAINQLIPNLRSERFFPTSVDGRMPLITAYPGRELTRQDSEDLQHPTEEFFLVAYVGNFSMGVPTETALRNAEAIIKPVKDTYRERKKLQLVLRSPDLNVGALPGIWRADLGAHTGIIPENPDLQKPLAIIRWTLTVQTIES